MKLFLWIAMFLFSLGSSTAQEFKLLQNQLKKAKSDTTRIRILNEISTHFYNEYKYDSSQIYANNALKLSTQLIKKASVQNKPKYLRISKKLYATSLVNYGASYMFTNPEQAIDTLLRAAQLREEIGSTTEKAEVYDLIGQTYSNQNNSSKSLSYYYKSLKLYLQLNNKKKIANLYYYIALSQRYMANYGDALDNNLKALNIAKNLKDTALIIEFQLANGFIYMLAQDYHSAIKSQKEALKNATIIKDSAFIATAYSDLGNSYDYSGNLEAAYTSFTKALNIRKRLKRDYYISSNLHYLSGILVRQGKTKEAIQLNKESVAFAKEYQDLRFIVESYNEIAANYLLIHDYDNAMKYYDTLYQETSKSEDAYYAPKALLGKSKIYLAQNNPHSAIKVLNQALTLTKSQDYINLEDIYQGLSIAYEKSGDFKNAYYSSLNFKKSSDSLLTIEKSDKLASLNSRLEFQNKQALQKLSQEKKLIKQQSQIRRQKLIQNISIASFMFVLVLAGLFFKRFHEKRKMNLKLEQTLVDLKSTQKQLIQSEKMASLGELTAGIAHEIQNPLNFVNNFSELSNELIGELQSRNEKLNIEDEEIKELLHDISQNLEKINQHGKRAEGIVKAMLLHSRSSTGQKEPTDINALCDEFLRLSYHGLRAKDKSFNVKFESDFDVSIPKINVVSQELGRVLLNLINNAFYAVTERKNLNEADFEPSVTITTKKEEEMIAISIKDNGIGIPEKVKDKIFQPFFTTKPTGLGTGLGLSLSYEIAKAHGGDIQVKSIEGKGSEFIIHLPFEQGIS